MQFILLTLCFTAGFLTLTGCGNDHGPAAQADPDNPIVQVLDTDAEKETRAPNTSHSRADALTHPDWVKVDSLPPEWGGLYAMDCLLAGPEDSRFFEYRDADRGEEYYFSYVVSPTKTNRAAQARVVIFNYIAWQNMNWPDHYLLFDNTKSFKQIEVGDGRAFGLFQTLDGSPWRMFDHLDTEYRETDITRWAVDLDNTDDYGSGPPCDRELAKPWYDISFEVHNGSGKLSLKDLLEK